MTNKVLAFLMAVVIGTTCWVSYQGSYEASVKPLQQLTRPALSLVKLPGESIDATPRELAPARQEVSKSANEQELQSLVYEAVRRAGTAWTDLQNEQVITQKDQHAAREMAWELSQRLHDHPDVKVESIDCKTHSCAIIADETLVGGRVLSCWL